VLGAWPATHADRARHLLGRVTIVIAPAHSTTHADRIDLLVHAYPGRVVLATDDDFATTVAAWNLAADHQPAAAVVPASIEEVRDAVLATREAGLRVTARCTGHNAGSVDRLDDLVLIRTERLDTIQIDVTARTARVGAGVLWEDVVEAASPHGLAALHGSSPNVGVVGYLLGGGLSFYARAHGLAVNHLRSVEAVLADGRVVHADRQQHADLFWALRGGGGSFAVVTAVEIDLLPIETVVGGVMVWPQERAPEVLRAWRDLTAVVDERTTTTFRLMNLPPLPALPDFLRGRRVVLVDGVALGNDDHARALLSPLRSLNPEVDTIAPIPAADVLRLHMDPEDPLPVVSDSAVLDDLDDDAVDRLLQHAGPDAVPRLLVTELRHLGGAVARRTTGAGAIGSLEGEYLLFAAGVAPTPDAADAVSHAAGEVVGALVSLGSHRPYANYVEHPVDSQAFYDDPTWQRLLEVKDRYDPEGLVVGGHGIDHSTSSAARHDA
jgi:FAD/FMN-containing dehydrogenase